MLGKSHRNEARLRPNDAGPVALSVRRPTDEAGEHPDLGGMIAVKDGRYGPYVNHGKVNATLPKDKDPQSVTLDEAVALIAAKAGAKAKGGGKGDSKTKAAAKKTAARAKG